MARTPGKKGNQYRKTKPSSQPFGGTIRGRYGVKKKSAKKRTQRASFNGRGHKFEK